MSETERERRHDRPKATQEMYHVNELRDERRRQRPWTWQRVRGRMRHLLGRSTRESCVCGSLTLALRESLSGPMPSR
eukprot:3612733-Pleurochrysis_carterae.AAC.1